MSNQAFPMVAMTSSSPSLLARRRAAERRFRLAGLLAVSLALGSLVILIGGIAVRGSGAFTQVSVRLPIEFKAETVDPMGTGEFESLSAGNYSKVVKDALRSLFPEVSGRSDLKRLDALVSSGAAFDIRALVLEDSSLVGSIRELSFPLGDEAQLFVRGELDRLAPESERILGDDQLAWLDRLGSSGRLDSGFNWRFLWASDSREPELAGILGALSGTMMTLLVTLALSLPLGVATAVHLEKFAPRNRWTDFVEININNLAAVPSIVFGLLGLAVFLNFFELPRSASLVGGLVLALMTLPTIIIASRAAIAAVPPSIEEAALGLGASRMQAVFHHVLPLAMPGILTGSILGMARAMGETAPLLMIGMVAFIADRPTGFADPATVLPVQIFLWADAPERAFVEKTSAAILILLAFLVAFNLLAVLLRKKLTVRW